MRAWLLDPDKWVTQYKVILIFDSNGNYLQLRIIIYNARRKRLNASQIDYNQDSFCSLVHGNYASNLGSALSSESVVGYTGAETGYI